MLRLNLKTDQAVTALKTILIKYLFILLIGYIIASLAAPGLWAKNVYLMHTIMEIICVFIVLATFLIIWNTYMEPLGEYQIIGFGFLSVAVFDLFHTYYLIGVNLLGEGYPHLSAKYWMIGRLVEAIVLAAATRKTREFRINKWIGLSAILFLSSGIAIAVLIYPGIMPAMFTPEGPTAMKLVLEYTVILLTLISLYNLRNGLEGEGTVSYKHIFMGLLFIIPAELSFTMYKDITAFHNTFGHVLKIICYYYFYKAVFVRSIEYPHKKLAEAYDKLEATNKRINEMDQVLNETLDALPLGILNYEHDNRIKYINKQLEELLGCDRNTVCGLTTEEFLKIVPTIEQEASAFTLTYESINDSVNTIRTFKNLRGEYVKLSLTSQKTNNGILIYFHEAKKEQEIKNFHLQTQTILNAVSNSILMIDKNKKIILHNEAFKKTYELNGIDIIGMHIDQFNEMVNFKETHLPDLLLSGAIIDHPQEISITTLKGNRREFLMYVAPIKNVEGEVIGAISATTDITEMKKHSHSMQQQEKLAMIGQMAAGIVHEIKNPLATIKGLSQLIKSKTGLEKVKEYANVINTAIDDASRVVNEFLSFAKPKPTVKARTSVNRIVESMQLITETQCYTKNIKSQFHYSSCPMEVTVDEIKIKQVILNITENAIAAMEGVESPELVISTYYDTDLREGIIEIRDNGAGMSLEVIDKLGTPFFTTREKGTGLGLGICYQIMNDHNGRIEVESKEGKGTVFKVIFTQIEDMI